MVPLGRNNEGAQLAIHSFHKNNVYKCIEVQKR